MTVAAQTEDTLLLISLQINHTEVPALSVAVGQSISITFIAYTRPTHTDNHFLIQEQNPEGINHVLLKPAVIKAESDMNLTTDGRLVGTFDLTGVLLGFTDIIFILVTDQNEYLLTSMPFNIKVQRIDSTLEKVFSKCLFAFIIVIYINMGCTLDIGGVVDVLKKPYAPLIALFLQYLLMPLVSYGIGYALFREEPAFWLGMLIVGSCPGGGGSNTWTHLLGGALLLSVTMTFISILVAFVALPLWFYLLGDTIFQNGIKLLPFGEMTGLMFGIALPCAVGIFINHFLPRVADVLRRLLTPAVVIFVLFATIIGAVTHLYTFGLFTWKVVLAGIALPWTGFAFGVAAGLIGRRPWQEVMAIAIETGVQNTSLSITIIKMVLEDWSPLGDLIVVIAVAVSLLTLPPLLVALVTKVTLKYCTAPQKDSDGIPLPIRPPTILTPLCPSRYLTNS